MFAHSRLDSLLVALAFGQFGLLLYGIASFGRVSWGTSVLVGLIDAFLICTNLQCVAHNFIHNPFFTRRSWNSGFATFNSLLVGGPQSLYRIHHLHHHKYNNDLPDPNTGMTRDPSSTWRHGEPPKREESLLRYAVLGYFRSDFGLLVSKVKRKGLARTFERELGCFVLALVTLAVLRPFGFFAFYVPVWPLGNCAAQAQSYFEHHGATPGNRKTDSVSSYGELYNLVWFNNGYHQEHHYRPQVHWTRVRELRTLLPSESERHVVWGTHWFNLGPVRRAAGTPASPQGERLAPTLPIAQSVTNLLGV